MAKKCIDISAWQGTVSVSDFQKVRESGIGMVILRASYTSQSGFNLHTDKVFDHNIINAYKAGMKVGAYHYSQATSETEAEKEAAYCLHIIDRYRNLIKLPVAFDWEFGGRLNSSVASKIGKQRCGQICDAFCRKIRSGGYTPMVYANLSTLNGFLPSDLYKRWSIWVAQYHSRCDYKHPHIMWQYSSSGRVPGISGRIDMNYFYPGAIQSESEKKVATKYQYELPKLPKRGWFTSGDKGKEVRRLQLFLNWYGDYGLDVDSEVGRQTINAVRMYQGREKLKVDGAFGQECLKRARTVRR